MSWQDELRRLDAALAAGQLSAEDYRRQQDQVLAAAAASPQRPGPAAQGQPPFPPPFRWAAASPASPQVMGPIAAESDATQIVRGAGGDLEATPRVRGAPLTANPDRPETPGTLAPGGPGLPPGQQGRQGQPEQQGWDGDPAGAVLPWGGNELGPLPQPDRSWHWQGPEVFQVRGPGSGRVIGIVVVAVLLVGAAVGAYWRWGRDPNAGGPQATGTRLATVRSTPPNPLTVARLPGTAEDHHDIKDFADVTARAQYLTDQEVARYAAARPGSATYVVHRLDTGNIATVLVVLAGDAPRATRAAHALSQLQLDDGMQPRNDVPPGVEAQQRLAQDAVSAMVRAHYAHGRVIVRVEVKQQAPSPDSALVLDDFRSVVAAQTKAVPADG